MDILPADQEVTAGDDVSLDIYVENVPDLGGYSFVIGWDPSVLGFTGVTNTAFLGSTGRTVTCLPPVLLVDSVSFSCTTVGVAPGPSGSDVIATLAFSSVGAGDSPVAFSAASATDSLALPLNPATADATVHVDDDAAVAVTLGTLADTYVDGGSSSSNYGSDASMFVDAEQSQPQRSFVMFDLSGIPPGSTVTSATLTLCYLQAAAQGVGRDHGLRMVTSAWTESAVTWDTQPTSSAAVTATITVPSTPRCLTFDGTVDVQAWLDGTTNWGWSLSDTVIEAGQHEVEYAAREHGTAALRPRLDITYLPP